MFCEEGMTIAKAKNALLVLQSMKHATPTKIQNNKGKIDKHCTNCGMTNHNVETCKKKKEQTIVTTIEATQLSQKPTKTSSYAWRICGLNGHKKTYCAEMQKMFHGKYVVVAKVQPIIEPQTITADVNVVDVNVTTRSKVTKEHVLKDKEPRNAKVLLTKRKKND
jgi:alpha-acetolactate decarboxylase